MAKRLTQSNTLLNYFSSPKSAKKTESKIEEKRKKPETNLNTDEEDEPLSVVKKRNRILDSDSDSENQTPSVSTPKKQKLEKKPSTPSTKLHQFSFASTTSTENTCDSPSRTAKASAKETENSNFEKSRKWLHETLKFIKPENIRDANRRKPTDVDYDPSTLYVPRDYLEGLTPAMRQWWELKSQHYDTVLFFKVGKFYELYHMDATVGVECLGFSYMKGEFAHSGFPEIAYSRMAGSLIEQGYKVARVEQTETPEMMAERCRSIKPTKFDKVVKREICQVSTKGVYLLGPQTLDAQPLGSYMIAITETSTNSVFKHFGVCFIEVTIGTFYLAEFDDDKCLSRLLTLMAHHNPTLVLLEREAISNDTMLLLGARLKDVRKEVSRFLEPNATVEMLKRECYFRDGNEEGGFQWPELFSTILDDGFPMPEYSLCLKSLGACIKYLQKSLIDVHVVQMKKFEWYDPIDLARPQIGSTAGKAAGSTTTKREFMIIDSVTIENLNLLGNEVGSLQKTLDYCCTAFGKRLLQLWICRPLCNADQIKKRQDAVFELYDNFDLLKSTRDLLAKLPDIERQIVKIHRFGNAFVAKNHPDSRAVFYEGKTYSKRKIQDLVSTLDAFASITKLTTLYNNSNSRLLQKLTQYAPIGNFVDLAEHLKFFNNAFDHKQAKEEGTIIPEQGVDPEYDAIQAEIKLIESKLDDYLEDQRRFFKCDIKYFGSDKKRFQLEVPESRCNKVTNAYQIEGTKKGSKPCKRYSTARSKELLAMMLKAESERSKIVQDLNRRIFEMFGERYKDWETALHSVTILDCLCSMAEYARLNNDESCMPKVMPFADVPICRMENARFPCTNTHTETFVPNDVHLGGTQQAVMILTGPNMGGKSTFMRQTVLISIMAQMGCFVPASTCEISLIDRIFTRMGAQDDIMRAQSTFLVELLEASLILKHANRHSFVLLDELGRGTSTHDGNAIARAYLRQLAEIKCRGIFATHYHSLVQKFDEDKNIQLGYMTCMLENEGTEKERVTFLYKVAQGLWPKSYGFHVAALAGMPASIVASARTFATAMELKDQNRCLLRNIHNLQEVLRILCIK